MVCWMLAACRYGSGTPSDWGCGSGRQARHYEWPQSGSRCDADTFRHIVVLVARPIVKHAIAFSKDNDQQGASSRCGLCGPVPIGSSALIHSSWCCFHRISALRPRPPRGWPLISGLPISAKCQGWWLAPLGASPAVRMQSSRISAGTGRWKSHVPYAVSAYAPDRHGRRRCYPHRSSRPCRQRLWFVIQFLANEHSERPG